MTRFIVVSLSLALCGCCWIWPSKFWGGCGEQLCYSLGSENESHFHVNKTATTPAGFMIDTSDASPNVDSFDRRMLAIEKCVMDVERGTPKLSAKQREDGACIPREYSPTPIKKDCLIVKFVKPHVSPCTGEHLIAGASAPESLCDDKPELDGVKCPCLWRTTLQNSYEIVTTSERVPLWNVARVMSGCNNVWKSPFARCAGL